MPRLAKTASCSQEARAAPGNARALLAKPPILLLDESTSALDGPNEQRMREAIDAVAQDRTLLVIAHRLSTVVDSDQIIVLEHGRILASAPTRSCEAAPLYAELANTSS